MSTAPHTTSATLKSQPAALADIHEADTDTLESILADIRSLWENVVAENSRELHLVSPTQAQQWQHVKSHVNDELHRIQNILEQGTEEADAAAANALLTIADKLAQHDHESLTQREPGVLAKLLSRLRNILSRSRRR